MLSRVPDAEAGFSSSAMLPTLREACEQAGLDSHAAELLVLAREPGRADYAPERDE